MAKKSEAPVSYEEITAELEQLIDKLQGNDLPLEQAVLAYERGTVLLEQAKQRLESTEQLIATLSPDGTPLPAGDASDN